MHIYNFLRGGHLLMTVLVAVAGTGAASADPPTFYFERLPALDDGGIRVVDLTETGMIAASAGHKFDATQRFEAVCADRYGALDILTNGPLPTKYYTAAMNEAGQAAGQRFVYDSQPMEASVFRYTPGVGVQNLGKLSGLNGLINDIAPDGTVVGAWQVANSSALHAYWTVGSSVVALPELGGTSSLAVDINDQGLIVGSVWTSAGTPRPVRWQNGQAQFLASFAGTAVACNNAGMVLIDENSAVGGAWLRMTNGSLLPLFCFGAPALNGTALSESGYAIGTWLNDQGRARGYRFNAGTFEMLNLGTLPGYELALMPQAVNDHGEVAGMAVNDQYEGTLFFWSAETGLVDLGALQPDTDVWHMNEVVALNNAGHILVRGFVLPNFSNTDAGGVIWQRRPGDVNGDRQVNFRDIDPFVAALAGMDAFRAAYPTGEWRNADITGDGQVSFADINPLVGLLGQ